MRLTRGRAAAVAWGLCALTVAIATTRLVLAIADPASAGPVTDNRVAGGGVPLAVFELFVFGAFAATAALVASRRPRNPVGWFLCTTPAFLSLGTLGDRWAWHAVLAGNGGGFADVAFWVSDWSWVPAMIPMFTFVPLLFPSGRPPTPRWRKVGWAAGAAMVLLFVALAFGPRTLDGAPMVQNPVGISGVDPDVLGPIALPLLLFAGIGAIASLVVRFRRSRGIEREQLKWVTAAATVLVLIWLTILFFDAEIPDEVSWASVMVGLLLVAAAVAIAILRYRLYDIDVVINRALVYGALTATLAVAYLGAVLVLQLALRPLTSDSNLAIAGSTLAVAALFRPARQRIQGAVDHRFFRRRYDATRTLEAFGLHLRDEVDLEALGGELRGVVAETMQPVHVSLWLRTPESTS